MEKILHNIKSYCEAHQLIRPDSTIIVGFSGGPDSLFLLYFLTMLREEYRLRIIAAHLDHGWRPASDADAAWCKKTAKSYAVEFVAAHAQDITHTYKTNGSPEELGRVLRRTFFASLAQEYNADAIALGHHAQDNYETFFLRLIRGSGISGLSGMQPRNGLYIKPLLQTSKHDILMFLQEKNLEYLTDETNTDQRFLRNKIRHTIMPTLQEADNRFFSNLQTTLKNLSETELFLQQLTEKIFTSISHVDNNTIHINYTQFLTQDLFMQKRLLSLLLIKNKAPFVQSQSLYTETLKFLHHASAKKHTLTPAWSLVKERDCFFIFPVAKRQHN
ncbi:MAG: tRNA lysidine(34) synthetase TilS [Candidatus Babeliaceae bacterium]